MNTVFWIHALRPSIIFTLIHSQLRNYVPTLYINSNKAFSLLYSKKKKLKKSCLNVICSSYYTECFLKDSSLLIMSCISIILWIILYHSKETWRSFTAHPHMTILSVPVVSLGYLSVWVHIYVCASVWLKPAHWRQYCIISSLLLSCITYMNSVIIYSL